MGRQTKWNYLNSCGKAVHTSIFFDRMQNNTKLGCRGADITQGKKKDSVKKALHFFCVECVQQLS